MTGGEEWNENSEKTVIVTCVILCVWRIAGKEEWDKRDKRIRKGKRG